MTENLHVSRGSCNPLHRRVQAQLTLKTVQNGPHVAARPAGYGAPLGPVLDLQQAVVDKKLYKCPRRKVTHFVHGSRPDRCAHGQQVALDKEARIATFIQQLTQGDVVTGPKAGGGLLIEAQDIP